MYLKTIKPVDFFRISVRHIDLNPLGIIIIAKCNKTSDLYDLRIAKFYD